LDFNQKLDMRRAFWAMGASTRLDVKLSALARPETTKSRSGTEEWSDLDVLGVEYAPMAGLLYAVADCKTTKLRATERVFWLRGIADLFHAQSAYLSRDAALPAAARQLALRLDIKAIDSRDRINLLDQAGTARLPKAGRFLEGETVRRWDRMLVTIPADIGKLARYRRSHYWVFPARRNLLQLPGYLQPHVKIFDVQQRWAQALVVDLAWLYLLAILQALEEVTKLHLSEFASSLEQVMVGGEAELRDKQALFKALIGIVGEQRMLRAGMSVVPPWFGELVDVATRAARRRAHATEALRILEFTGVETIANQGVSWRRAFPDSDPLDMKLASDVVRFICRSTGLSADFVKAFDTAVMLDQSQSSPGQPPLDVQQARGGGRVRSDGAAADPEGKEPSLFPDDRSNPLPASGIARDQVSLFQADDRISQ
jgi:hypothetical protein